MSIAHYSSGSDIVYIIVDRTHTYNTWVSELMKNISDFTLSNIWAKHYSILTGVDEDQLLNAAADNNYTHAVVISTGTEFINGEEFFNNVKTIIQEDFFIMGHILDRKEAYYELHHQCYIINLNQYKTLNRPIVGNTSLGEVHRQYIPQRSQENIHDDYTPTWILRGNNDQEYNHKLHGWNILSSGLKHGYTIKVFTENFRNNKKYYYPENLNEFNKHVSWAYSRERYCLDQHIHKENTELVEINETDFECVVTPASGIWFIPYIAKDKPVKIIYYDYNQSSLDYWRENSPKINNVSYEYIKIDLLGICDYSMLIPTNSGKTIISLSNIFCYEGTSMFASLTYRLHKENEILKHIPKDFYVFFNSRSTKGFINSPEYGKNLEIIKLNQLSRPTWHTYDWL